MDELKQARERRAASARQTADRPDDAVTQPFRNHPVDDWRGEQDGRPFWERDDPFGSDGFTPKWRTEAREEEPPQRRRNYIEDDYEEERPMNNTGQTRGERGAGRARAAQQEARVPRADERRRPAENSARRKTQEQNGHAAANTRQQASHRNEPKSRASLLMMMLLLGLLALAVFIGMKVFEITAISVNGNDTMTADEVIKLSGIVKGENIFRVNIGQAKRNLESNPLVEVIGISRIFPDKIKIEMRNRKPHGAIAYMGAYVIIDENGVALDERPDLPSGQYPLVNGVDIKPADKGKPVAGLDKNVMKTMKTLLTALYDYKAITYVSEIDMSDPGQIRMLTADGLRIDAGKPTDLDKKADWIARSVPELRSTGHTTGVLYVSGTSDPVYSETGESGQSKQ